jgi:transposase
MTKAKRILKLLSNGLTATEVSKKLKISKPYVYSVKSRSNTATTTTKYTKRKGTATFDTQTQAVHSDNGIRTVELISLLASQTSLSANKKLEVIRTILN